MAIKTPIYQQPFSLLPIGKGRVKVHATFNGIPYDGSIVNMGLKDEQGNICYIIGVTKAIREALHVTEGDMIHVTITKRS